MKIDKSKWMKVSFGDIATESRDTIRDYVGKPLSRYIGLEHIEPENLTISRWGETAEGVSFTKTFKAGDILFGRRRAYQKKAAIASFDGVCSGDILVFRPKTDRVIPALFPFLIQNDRFFDFAMKTSAGSLSPRTKFKDLSRFEIHLPPINEQIELSQIIQMGHSLKMNTNRLLVEYSNLFESELCELFCDFKQYVLLKDIIDESPRYGASKKAVPYKPNSPRYIRITDIDVNGDLYSNTLSSIDGDRWEDYMLKDGDILLVRTADPGKSFLYKKAIHGDCVFAGYLIKFHLDKKVILPEFFFAFTKTSNYWSQIKKRLKKGTLANINTAQFESILVPVPSIQNQEHVVQIMNKHQCVLELLTKKKSRENIIMNALINEIFK